MRPRARTHRLAAFALRQVSTPAKKKMSSPAAALIKRKREKRRNSESRGSDDDIALKRARNIEKTSRYRRKKRLELSILVDKVAALEKELRRKAKKIEDLEYEIRCLESLLDGNVETEMPDNDDDADSDAGDSTDAEDEEVEKMGGWDEREVEKVYQIAMARPNQFRSLTGLQRDGFESLLVLAHDAIATTTMTGAETKINKNDKTERLTARLQLFATVFYMRQYPSMRVASAYLRIPVMYLKKVITRVISALDRVAASAARDEGGLAWPTKEELALIRQQQANIKLLNINPDYAIDGMHIRIRQPARLSANDQKAYWNGKHKCWCLMVIVVTDMRGRPVYLSDPLPGGEWRVVQNLDIKAKCKETDAAIVGDALYAFNRATDKKETNIKSYFTLGPKTVSRLRIMAGDDSLKPAVVEEAKAELRSTKAASRLRVVVENTIARMRHWAILARDSPFRHYIPPGIDRPTYYIDIVKAARAAVFLASRAMLDRAPRAADWRPNDDDGTAKYGYHGEPLNAKNVELRVRALFKMLNPKKKVQIDGEDADDDSVEWKESGKGDAVDWSNYEEKDDFLVMQQRATTARQIKNKEAGARGKEKQRARVAYDALDQAEGVATTSSRWKSAPATRATKKKNED